MIYTVAQQRQTSCENWPAYLTQIKAASDVIESKVFQVLLYLTLSWHHKKRKVRFLQNQEGVPVLLRAPSRLEFV